MKITELYKSIIDALYEKGFVGSFEVTIYHAGMDDIKITGCKQNEKEFPSYFSIALKSEINEICFKIISGILVYGDFNFDIKGQIEYLYTHGVEEWTIILMRKGFIS